MPNSIVNQLTFLVPFPGLHSSVHLPIRPSDQIDTLLRDLHSRIDQCPRRAIRVQSGPLN